jgi:hypothetical protein
MGEHNPIAEWQDREGEFSSIRHASLAPFVYWWSFNQRLARGIPQNRHI